MNTDELSFRHLREAFAIYNQTTGKSPATIRWYEYRLELFHRWLGEDARLHDLTVANARGYIAELQNRTERHVNNPFVKDKNGTLSSSYISGFARALRAFSSWLHADGYTSDNRLKGLRPPKVQQKVVEVLTDEEINRLVSVFRTEEPFGARDHAIVWTMLDCGLRASEVCELTLEDAHLAQGYLKILGKGNKERLVPIGHGCQEALLHWRDRYRPLFDALTAPYLFLNANGSRLSVDALEGIVERAGRRARIPRLHCHLLRHTFATGYLVREVGDPLRLQQILGHTSLEMTRRYVAIANVQRSVIERRSSPMDLILGTPVTSSSARRLQPRRTRGLRVVK